MAVHPSYLKLDRSLISGIDVDRERAALVGALVDYATRVDCLLVAEGMESEAELLALIELGVPLAQGFYLGRPAQPWPGMNPHAMPASKAVPTRTERDRALAAPRRRDRASGVRS
jgi:EAL domain-containing protein (putative c-di-GMP-specific phosphodiesterase class I)